MINGHVIDSEKNISALLPMTGQPKVHFLSNGIFSTSIAGGDMVFFNLARAAARQGFAVNYFGGHAFQEVARREQLPGTVTLTDDAPLAKSSGGLTGQFALLRDFHGRYRRTLQLQNAITPDDFVCAASDYWFDVLPVVHCAARHKLMVWNMESPALRQIIQRSRPDVDATRLAALHYWASQTWSLRQFARCPTRHMIYLHPLMEPKLEQLRIRATDRTLISYGLDPAATEAMPEQKRIYDAVWIGRVHRQKGVGDLLATFKFLAKKLENFRAILIGNLQKQLQPEIEKLGLQRHVEFSGFVSEEEKIRLFKASRVFLMPSKHEGSPRVIGESIVAVTPVVAYEIPNYRPLFGDLVRYVPPFDLAAFQKAAELEILKMRAGENYLQHIDLADFKQENSWAEAQERFLGALAKLRAITDAQK
jgi:glycosyltransferase involved in cell wall biosynthesis